MVRTTLTRVKWSSCCSRVVRTEVPARLQGLCKDGSNSTIRLNFISISRSSCMSVATTSALLLRQTISRQSLRLRNGCAVVALSRRSLLNPTPPRAGYELGWRLPDVRGYASQQPPGGMGGGTGIPNFLFQQPRQKGETLKEYVSPQNARYVIVLFIPFAERRSHRNGA